MPGFISLILISPLIVFIDVFLSKQRAGALGLLGILLLEIFSIWTIQPAIIATCIDIKRKKAVDVAAKGQVNGKTQNAIITATNTTKAIITMVKKAPINAFNAK